jgi:uncharacterized RDD family membrane protein YckC
MSAAPAPPPETLQTPGLARRLAAFVYEGVLLFGVLMIAGYLYSSLIQQHHALQGQSGLQAFLFIVLAIYFVWFWSHGGQTVAMRAWHVRLVAKGGGSVTQARAAMRYLACWVWFLPALAAARLADLHSAAQIFALMAVGVLGYALLARLHPRRQFWHDALCGTQLVTWRPQMLGKAPANTRAQSDG